MRPETLEQLRSLKALKQPTALLTQLDSGDQEVLSFAPGEAPVSRYGASIVAAAREALAFDRSRSVDIDGQMVFVQAINPPLRMAIIGAVHITQGLAPMAVLLGYDVTVIDPRRAFADAGRFPGIKIDSEWPDDALESFAPDSRTAVVTLTHDPKLDDPALHVALRSEAFYIGCLGSKRTHAARCERLRAAGFNADSLSRICGPVGLDIGARSPAEIAVSIVAQVTAQLRRSPTCAVQDGAPGPVAAGVRGS